MGKKYDIATDLQTRDKELSQDTKDALQPGAELTNLSEFNKAVEQLVVDFLTNTELKILNGSISTDTNAKTIIETIKEKGDLSNENYDNDNSTNGWQDLFLAWVNKKINKNYTSIDELNDQVTQGVDFTVGGYTILENLRIVNAFDEIKTILGNKNKLKELAEESKKQNSKDIIITVTNNENVRKSDVNFTDTTQNNPDNNPDHDPEVVTEQLNFTEPTGINVPYNGATMNLVHKGSFNQGEDKEYIFQYKFGTNDWSQNIPEASEAGTYTIERRIVKKDDHNQEYKGDNYPSTRTITSKITKSTTVVDNPDGGDVTNVTDPDTGGESDVENVSETIAYEDRVEQIGGTDGNILTVYQDIDGEVNVVKDDEIAGKYKRKMNKTKKKIGTVPCFHGLQKIDNNAHTMEAANGQKINLGDKYAFEVSEGTFVVVTKDDGKLWKKLIKKTENKKSKEKTDKVIKKTNKEQQKQNQAQEAGEVAVLRSDVDKMSRRNIADSVIAFLKHLDPENASKYEDKKGPFKRVPWSELLGKDGTIDDTYLNGFDDDNQTLDRDDLKTKLKDEDVNHKHAIKKFIEVARVQDIRLLKYIQNSQTDLNIISIKKAIEAAQEMTEIDNPFKFFADLGHDGNIDIKHITGSGTEAQIYNVFLHECDREKGNDGYFNIIAGSNTSRVIDQFMELTTAYNAKVVEEFKESVKGETDQEKFKEFKKFVKEHPDFSVIYLISLNTMTTRMRDLSDAVAGRCDRIQYKKLDPERYLEMEEKLENSPLMQGFENQLNALRQDPKYGDYERGTASLGALDRETKRSFMMNVEEVFSNQLVQIFAGVLLPAGMSISGQKDIQIVDDGILFMGKKLSHDQVVDIMSKCHVRLNLLNDAQNMGPRFMKQAEVEFTKDALESIKNWFVSNFKEATTDYIDHLKEGNISLELPIFDFAVSWDTNLKKAKNSDLSKVKGVQSLGVTLDCGARFGFKVGAKPSDWPAELDWNRVNASVNASIGAKFDIDYERGIEVNVKQMAKVLDRLDDDNFIENLTYDTCAEKVYKKLIGMKELKDDDALGDLIKNNRGRFEELCKQLPHLIGPEFFKMKEANNVSSEDFKKCFKQCLQGFLEGVKACQVRFLDHKTRFSGASASLQVDRKVGHISEGEKNYYGNAKFGDKEEMNLRGKLRDKFGINASLKIGVSVSSFMMKYCADADKLRRMDDTLKEGIDFGKRNALLEGKSASELKTNLENYFGIRGLKVEVNETIEKNINGKTTSEVVLSLDDNAIDDKGNKVTKLHEMINIYYNGTKPGKDFYYEGGKLHIGNILSLNFVQRLYFGKQAYYLFLNNGNKGLGVNNSDNPGHLPLKTDIAKMDEFTGLEKTDKTSFTKSRLKDELNKQGDTLGAEVRTQIENNLEDRDGTVIYKGNPEIDLSQYALKVTKDANATPQRKIEQGDALTDSTKMKIQVIDKQKPTEVVSEIQEKEIFPDFTENLTDGDLGLPDLDDRDIGSAMCYALKRLMSQTRDSENGSNLYNTFLNHIGGSSTDDYLKAKEALEKGILKVKSTYFSRSDTRTVPWRREVGSRSNITIQKERFEKIEGALRIYASNPQKLKLIMQRVGGILAHEEILYREQSKFTALHSLDWLINQRKDTYERLYGPGGNKFPDELKGIRKTFLDTYKDQLANDKGFNRTKITSLFGYTAFYHHANDMDTGTEDKDGGGKTYDPTMLGQTEILGSKDCMLVIDGEKQKEKQQAACKWLKENMDAKTSEDSPDYKLAVDTIKEQLKDLGVSETKFDDRLKENNLFFKPDGETRVPQTEIEIDGAKITLGIDIVFYLYGPCANESLGLNIREIKVQRDKQTEPHEGGKTYEVGGERVEAYNLNTGRETQSVNARINIYQDKLNIAWQKMLKKKIQRKQETDIPPEKDNNEQETQVEESEGADIMELAELQKLYELGTTGERSPLQEGEYLYQLYVYQKMIESGTITDTNIIATIKYYNDNPFPTPILTNGIDANDQETTRANYNTRKEQESNKLNNYQKELDHTRQELQSRLQWAQDETEKAQLEAGLDKIEIASRILQNRRQEFERQFIQKEYELKNKERPQPQNASENKDPDTGTNPVEEKEVEIVIEPTPEPENKDPDSGTMVQTGTRSGRGGGKGK